MTNELDILSKKILELDENSPNLKSTLVKISDELSKISNNLNILYKDHKLLIDEIRDLKYEMSNRILVEQGRINPLEAVSRSNERCMV